MCRVYFLEEKIHSRGQLMVKGIGHVAGHRSHFSKGESARLSE